MGDEKNLYSKEIIYEIYFLSDMLRREKIFDSESVWSIFEKIPFGIVAEQINKNETMLIFEWVMNYLNYEYKDGEYVKK